MQHLSPAPPSPGLSNESNPCQDRCGIGRIVHGYVPAAKTLFTLVSVYPFCSMVPGVFGCPIGDAIPFRRFIEIGRPGPERAKITPGRSAHETVWEKKEGCTPEGRFSSFPIINNNAAGIDIGSEEHWVAVPEGRDENPVRPFGCFTSDLHAMARWLEACGVTIDEIRMPREHR